MNEISKFSKYSHSYPKANVCYIYETTFEENGETFYYIGSHKPNSLSDTYCGSSKKILELKKQNKDLNFRILREVAENENRFEIEGEYIKECCKSKGMFCINKITDPINVMGIHWDKNHFEKYKKTCKEKYGNELFIKTEEFLEKARKTNKERYGTEFPFQNETVKAHIKETMRERYNVDYPMQSEIIKEKSKQTLLKKFGVENISQVEEIKKKISETLKNKTEEEKEDAFNKSKETILKHFGNWENYKEFLTLQNKQTKKEKYGDENYNNDEKRRVTNLKKYGVENYVNIEQRKETNKEKYGTEKGFVDTKEFKEKRKKFIEKKTEILKNMNVPVRSNKKGIYPVWCTAFEGKEYSFYNRYSLFDFLEKNNLTKSNPTYVFQRFRKFKPNIQEEAYGLIWVKKEEKLEALHLRFLETN